MKTKTKVWVAVSVSAVLLAGAGSVFAASGSSSQTGHHAKGSHFGEKGGPGGVGDLANNAALLSLLNVDAATLQKDLQAGQSLADIAAAQKADEQKVIDLLVNDVKQQLASAVQAGKLTQAQADQKTANLAADVKKRVEQKGGFDKEGPEFGGKGGPAGFGGLANNAALLSLLNVDAATLQKDLQAGQSLADIAAAQKVDEQKVIDLLVNDVKQQLASAVQAGKLTQAQADQKTANLAADVKKRVEQKGGFDKEGPEFGGKGGPAGFGDLANNSALLSLLNLDAAALRKDLQAGQSLADIAAAQQVDEQKVIDLLVNDMKQQIVSAVQAGKLTQAQADQKSANLPAEVKQMVERKGNFGKPHGRGGQSGSFNKQAPNTGNQASTANAATQF